MDKTAALARLGLTGDEDAAGVTRAYGQRLSSMQERLVSAQTDAERERNRANRLQSQLDQQQARARDLLEERGQLERRLSAQRGVLTRVKNRIIKGVCPCCNRHFADLSRHMQTQHPDFASEGAAP